MQLVERYLIAVYVIPEKVDAIISAVKSVNDLLYGNYKWVYWQSSVGTEFYNVLKETGQNISEDQINSNPTVKLEFSIERNKAILESVLNKIIETHPWEEPVIRIFEISETRNDK